MTDTSAFFAGARSAQQTDFDQYDRYMLPDESGEYSGWTRATTFASTLAESYGLRLWEQRMVVWGLSRRPDLLALANTVSGPEDKKALGAIVTSAHEAAGTKAKANLGDAVHKACEEYDRGNPVPEMHQRDVSAYASALHDHGYTVLPEGIERIVIVPQYHVAGRFDRLVRCPDSKIRVLDIKTGNLDYASVEFAVQLSLYANASAVWDSQTKQYVPMPPIATDYAIIAHIPSGSAVCEMMRVNIDVGWALTRLCAEVRDAVKIKHLITPMPRQVVTVGERGPEMFVPPMPRPQTVPGGYVDTRSSVSAEYQAFWSDDRHDADNSSAPAPVAESTSGATGPGAPASVPDETHADLTAAAAEAQREGATPQSVLAAAGAPVEPSYDQAAAFEDMAQAIVKSAKGKAAVQQIARNLCASLNLPESTVKLNQQQIKIARAIVELANKQGVPVPGIALGNEPAAPSVDQVAAEVTDAYRGTTLASIAAAPTVGSLQQIREITGSHWTEEMNEAARVRAEQLSAVTGAVPLTPLQMIEGATSKQTLSLAWKVATEDGRMPDGWTPELHAAAQTKLQQL